MTYIHSTYPKHFLLRDQLEHTRAEQMRGARVRVVRAVRAEASVGLVCTLNGILRSGCATSGRTCNTGLTSVRKRSLPVDIAVAFNPGCSKAGNAPERLGLCRQRACCFTHLRGHRRTGSVMAIVKTCGKISRPVVLERQRIPGTLAVVSP